MGNPLYDMLRQSQNQNPVFQIMQAMRNPGQFVRQAFPDIPDNIANDPNQILQYLQQTRNISNEQIQAIANLIPR